MADYQIGDKEFAKYEAWLQKEDKAMGTRLKYQRDAVAAKMAAGESG